MIDTAAVAESLAELGIPHSEQQGLGAVVGFACGAVSSRLSDKTLEADPRASFLAAALANYLICCGSQSQGFDSFSAGDVSFSVSSQRAENARLVLSAAEKGAEGFLGGAFDFRAV